MLACLLLSLAPTLLADPEPASAPAAAPAEGQPPDAAATPPAAPASAPAAEQPAAAAAPAAPVPPSPEAVKEAAREKLWRPWENVLGKDNTARVLSAVILGTGAVLSLVGGVVGGVALFLRFVPQGSEDDVRYTNTVAITSAVGAAGLLLGVVMVVGGIVGLIVGA